jgi:hypothetical protein
MRIRDLPFRRRLKLAGWISLVIPQPGVPGERSLLAGVERSGGICFCLRCILLLLAAAVASAALTGCGPNIIVSRTHTYAITVSASSGALSHAASAGLIVQ